MMDSEIGSGNREWSVGELAGAAGVTGRTLHHHDQVGLLVPAARTDAGHRRYPSEQAERLYEDHRSPADTQPFA